MRVAFFTDSTCYRPTHSLLLLLLLVHAHASKPNQTKPNQASALRMAADGGCVFSSSAPTLPCSFSPKSRHYLAVCAQDGRLRIWNADSRALHREYVPSAHLSATCTCIAWGPCRATKVHGGPGRILNSASLTHSRALPYPP